MSKLVALNKQAHRELRVETSKVEGEGADLNMVPVVVSEFRKLIVHYPIVFSKNAQTGQFMCSALLGFEQGENLFWQNGAWQGVYIPLQITRQPFFLGQGDARTDSDNLIMCINEASPVISKERGEPLFDEQGNPSAYLQKQQSNLSQLFQGEQHTVEFVKTMLDLELLTAMTLDIKFANQSSTKINGLYTIDEDKLAKLSTAQLQSLQQADYLSAVYAMVHSTGQIYSLIEKKNQRLEKAQDWFKSAAQA